MTVENIFLLLHIIMLDEFVHYIVIINHIIDIVYCILCIHILI